MRGTVVGYDSARDEGFLRDEYNNQFRFQRANWRADTPPIPGGMVDFQGQNGMAYEVHPMPASGFGAGGGYGPGPGPGGYGPGGYGPGGYGSEAAKKSLTYGIISLVCALISMVLGLFGIITVIPAIIFGVKATKLGKHQPDKTGYYLGMVGLILGIIGIVLLLVLLLIGVAVIGTMGAAGGFR